MPGKSGNRLAHFAKLLVDMIFILGILILLSLPASLNYFFKLFFKAGHENYPFLLVFLYITGVLSLMIVYEGKKILGRLNSQNPFVVGNVTSFKKVAYYSFIIALAFIVKVIFFITILTVVAALAFILTGLNFYAVNV
jgi:hypothetical protein